MSLNYTMLMTQAVDVENSVQRLVDLVHPRNDHGLLIFRPSKTGLGCLPDLVYRPGASVVLGVSGGRLDTPWARGGILGIYSYPLSARH